MLPVFLWLMTRGVVLSPHAGQWQQTMAPNQPHHHEVGTTDSLQWIMLLGCDAH
jgi:hypothetical protein